MNSDRLRYTIVERHTRKTYSRSPPCRAAALSQFSQSTDRCGQSTHSLSTLQRASTASRGRAGGGVSGTAPTRLPSAIGRLRLARAAPGSGSRREHARWGRRHAQIIRRPHCCTTSRNRDKPAPRGGRAGSSAAVRSTEQRGADGKGEPLSKRRQAAARRPLDIPPPSSSRARARARDSQRCNAVPPARARRAAKNKAAAGGQGDSLCVSGAAWRRSRACN
jgi:hypothetical protein